MSTLDSATGQAQSTASSVDDVIAGLAAVDGELDDAISQFQAVGVSDKAAEAGSAKDTVDTLKSQAAALKSGIEELATQIQAISG